jgi:hypothetical protein
VSPPIERLLRRVARSDGGCWEWTGARDSNGYGRCSPKYGEQWAHRLFYRELIGPLPDGLVIDHLCRNRCCVNPAHLEPVTRAENARRSPIVGGVYRERSKKTHCVNGHERTPENLYRAPVTGHTQCRTCRTERARGLR